jgi:uncharacterized protein YeaO (DUF488 family)
MIQCKRVYDTVSERDGYRVLVDRLWPRGISKEALACDEWCKALSPSTQLRRDFHAETLDFAGFREAYLQELAGHAEDGLRLLKRQKKQTVTLLYAAKNEQQNHALVLAEWLNSL